VRFTEGDVGESLFWSRIAELESTGSAPEFDAPVKISHQQLWHERRFEVLSHSLIVAQGARSRFDEIIWCDEGCQCHIEYTAIVKCHGAGAADWFMDYVTVSDSVRLGVDVWIVAEGARTTWKAKAVSKNVPENNPKVADLKTGNSIPYPEEPLVKPDSGGLSWPSKGRGAFDKEWLVRGYETPDGGWGASDTHQIKPREYSGDHPFDNLTPVLRDVHQSEFNKYWRNFGKLQ
jgi:hypothetical protein